MAMLLMIGDRQKLTNSHLSLNLDASALSEVGCSSCRDRRTHGMIVSAQSGEWLSRLERTVHIREVTGSNPVSPTDHLFPQTADRDSH